MPPKKKPVEEEEEDGPAHFEEDLDEMKDDMLVDDDTPERSDDEVLNMLRDVECADCKGSSSRKTCQVRKDYGCPSDKKDK